MKIVLILRLGEVKRGYHFEQLQPWMSETASGFERRMNYHRTKSSSQESSSSYAGDFYCRNAASSYPMAESNPPDFRTRRNRSDCNSRFGTSSMKIFQESSGVYLECAILSTVKQLFLANSKQL